MAYEAKTIPARIDVAGFLKSIADEGQRRDGEELLVLFEKSTLEAPTIWGTSIIGFGQYDYTYSSGHSGTAAKTGFALRKSGLVIYLCPGFETLGHELAHLGPHKLGKGCLYLKSLTGIDRNMLSAMIIKSVAEIDRLYPKA